MARIRINERVLEALGFVRREVDEGSHDYVIHLHRGWSIEYSDGLVELVHDGESVPLRCSGVEHLELLIKVL